MVFCTAMPPPNFALIMSLTARNAWNGICGTENCQLNMDNSKQVNKEQPTENKGINQ